MEEARGHDEMPMASDEDELVTLLSDDIVDEVRSGSKKDRSDMLLYSFIHTGEMNIVKNVFQRLAATDNSDVLRWVVRGEAAATGKKADEEGLKISDGTRGANICVYLLIVLVSIIIFPIVYFCHNLTISIAKQLRKRRKLPSDLPIIFALRSENSDMFDLFQQEGYLMTDRDSEGNNVFHYLANLSKMEPEATMRIFDFLAGRGTELHDILMKDENDDGITGLEATARYGSIVYLHHILGHTDITGKNGLLINDKVIEVDLPKANLSMVRSRQTTSHGRKLNARIQILDFEPFEQGDVFKKQSLLLHLVADREVAYLTADDANIINHSRVFTRWIAMKKRKYWVFSLVAHIASLAISAALVTEIILNNGDMNAAPLVGAFMESSIRLLENGSATYWEDTVDPALNEVYEQCRGKLSERNVRLNIFKSADSEQDYIVSIDILHFVILAVVWAHMIYQLICIQFFIAKNFNFRGKTVVNALYPVFTRSMPGSYTEKQLGLIMYVVFSLLTIPLKIIKKKKVPTATLR